MYKTYYQNSESELFNLSELFYLVKEYNLIEIVLENNLYIRQWKDLDAKIELDWELVDMKYWTLYLTDGDKLLKVWNWRWEDELKEFIDECSSLKYDFWNQVFIS